MKTGFLSLSIALCLLVQPVWAQSEGPKIPFDIDMQAEIQAGRFNPQTDRVGLRGNTPPLAWDRSLPLQAGEAGHYQATLTLPQGMLPGQSVQYKLKIDRPDQGEGDGWEKGRNHLLTLDTPKPQVQRPFGAEPVVPPLSRVGRIDRLEPLASRFIAPRKVQVWLPPDYGQSPKRRYPVLYVHDGQAVFDTATMAAEWQLDEAAQRLALTGRITPPIIVAIDNTPDRIAEYTPVPGPLPARLGVAGNVTGGKAPDYARYLIEELKPWIDRHYRTLPQARYTTIGGSSLGGLVSLWMLAHYPKTFSAALVVSPALWWSDRHILQDVHQQFPKKGPRPRIWLDMGLREGTEAVDNVRALHAVLLGMGWNASTLRYVEDPDASHDEASWARRVEGMLMFLYGRYKQ